MSADELPDPVLRLRTDDLAARDFESEAVVLDLRSSTYLATNSSGRVLWHRLEQGATRSQLVDALLEGFDVERERAASDVDAFLADCRRRGLLSEQS